MRKLLQHEMEHLSQEQVRVLLLNRRNRLLGQRVIYHGNLYSCMVRAAEVYRPAVIRVGSRHHHGPQPPLRPAGAQP